METILNMSTIYYKIKVSICTKYSIKILRLRCCSQAYLLKYLLLLAWKRPLIANLI